MEAVRVCRKRSVYVLWEESAQRRAEKFHLPPLMAPPPPRSRASPSVSAALEEARRHRRRRPESRRHRRTLPEAIERPRILFYEQENGQYALSRQNTLRKLAAAQNQQTQVRKAHLALSTGLPAAALHSPLSFSSYGVRAFARFPLSVEGLPGGRKQAKRQLSALLFNLNCSASQLSGQTNGLANRLAPHQKPERPVHHGVPGLGSVPVTAAMSCGAGLGHAATR